MDKENKDFLDNNSIVIIMDYHFKKTLKKVIFPNEIQD